MHHRNQILIVSAFSLAFVLWIWCPQLNNALFVDEAGSFWVIKDGAAEAFKRSIEIQGQSPFYYLVLLGWSNIFGTSEVALRSLSVVFMLAACALFASLAWIRRSSSYLLALPILGCSHAAVFSAVIARPYGMGLFLALCSIVAIELWLKRKNTFSLYLSAVSSALAIYAHPTLIAALPITAFLIWQSKVEAENYRSLIKAAALGIVVMLPALAQMIFLSSRIGEISIASEAPNLAAIVWHFISIPLLATIVLLAIVKCTVARGRELFESLDRKQLNLALIWFFTPKLVTLIAALFVNATFLIDRYSILSVFGECLLIGVLISAISERILAGLVYVPVFLAVVVPWGLSFFPDTAWKPIVNYIRENDAENRCKKFALVGFTEARHVSLLQDETSSAFIKSPLSYYGIDITLLPLYSSKNEAAYFEQVVYPKVKDQSCVFLIEWQVDGARNGSLETGAATLSKYLIGNSLKKLRRIDAGTVSLVHFVERTLP